MPASFHFGVRHEQTDVRSAALNTTYDSSSWVNAGNELNIVAATDENGEPIKSFTDVKGDYDVTLPNVDFDIEPWEDIILRVSFSETITRPNYEQIKGGLTPRSTQYRGNERPEASAGNPGLVPIQSENLDLSFEWYYDDGSYLSIGYFEKDVDRLLLDLVTADRVVGFNVDRFDLRVLSAYTDHDLSRIRTCDMLKEIQAALGYRLSLQHLAEVNLG